MTRLTPHGDAHAQRHARTALEDSDEATVRYSVCASLQLGIVVLTDLHLQSRHTRWNAVGEDFQSLRMNLEDIAAVTVSAADEVAERVRALDGVPDGRPDKIATAQSLPRLPDGLLRTRVVLDLIVDRLSEALSKLRDVEAVTAQHDPPSSTLLNGIILELENERWKLRAAHSEL